MICNFKLEKAIDLKFGQKCGLINGENFQV